MSAEQIYKFQPDRTMYLRGFTGFGAAAALCQTSPTGFTVCGVFRDMADFCVLVLYDADNSFEHYSLRYLPDFDLSGVTLTFDLTYQGLQPIDSAKYSWIDWSQMDVINVDRVTGADLVNDSANASAHPSRVRLWDYATLQGGDFSVAQGTYQILAPGGCTVYDRLTLFVNNVEFDFVASGGESAEYVAQTFASRLNSQDWSTYSDSAVSVLASSDGAGNLTLKNARTGHVSVSGTAVQWLDGIKFPGIAPGSTIYLGGSPHIVDTVQSPTSLTLTASGPMSLHLVYLAECGGIDGNGITTYMVVRPANETLNVAQSVMPLSGGNSDNVTWHINLDFSALSIDYLRQAWLTFAPQLTTAAAYSSSEWTATFSNWSVKSIKDNMKFLCAGPGSVRIGNDETTACTYTGSGWSIVSANNYWHGFGRQTTNPGDAVTVTYTCASVHNLNLGSSLDANRGIISVTLDGDEPTTQNLYLDFYSEVVTRRVLRAAVPAGTHKLTLTLTGPAPNDAAKQFLFDFIEASVPGDFPDALVVYGNVSPALDFDTDATYKVSPQRLLWHLNKLGFAGQINEYVGVFWWNERKRVNSIWNSVVITFSGAWAPGDIVTLSFDSAAELQGAPVPLLNKTVTSWDTSDTIANHFVFYINAGSIITRAEKTGSGQLTIYTRTPNWKVSAFSAVTTSQAGLLQAKNFVYTQASNTTALSNSGVALDYGADGAWQVDTSAANPLNYPVRQWHSDFFAGAKSQGLQVTTSFSMELVNPPTDDETVANAWCARFYDGTPVQTDTGFANLSSTQCAPVSNLTAFQGAAFTAMAALQTGAGLTPWLQFGEFLWWFFSSVSQPIGYCSFSNPISIGLANPHGMQSGDRVVISGVLGCTAANGTFPITVTDATHFTLPASADGQWIAGTGVVRGGSMAFYDAVTSAAAQTALGRGLYKFTCQDDDPTINGGADTEFLAVQLKAHVDGIRSAVLAEYPSAQFEILFPNDVNNPVCYSGPHVQYPQGGRLNAAVNLPSAWRTKVGSGLDRFKVEALSWGAQYLNLDLAEQAINLAISLPFSWQTADVAYLVPWFNGTCPWKHEFHSASTRGIGLINFWAYDHLALMSWPLPFTPPVRRAFRKV